MVMRRLIVFWGFWICVPGWDRLRRCVSGRKQEQSRDLGGLISITTPWIYWLGARKTQPVPLPWMFLSVFMAALMTQISSRHAGPAREGLRWQQPITSRHYRPHCAALQTRTHVCVAPVHPRGTDTENLSLLKKTPAPAPGAPGIILAPTNRFDQSRIYAAEFAPGCGDAFASID